MQRTATIAAVTALVVSVAAGCGTPAPNPGAAGPDVARPAAAPVRIVLAGDVMLGRDVAPLLDVEGPGVLAGVRRVVAGADLALANLESPLTDRPSIAHGHDLRASGDAARHLQVAGFDAVSIANNHACDAGTAGMADTLAALAQQGLQALGTSPAAEIRQVGDLTVAVLAFDLTGGSRPCLPEWDRRAARSAVTAAVHEADVVVAGIHGGVEHLPAPDPALQRIASELARWGADVVWGHGAHIAYPVEVRDPDGDGRRSVVAPGLGNLLFDQAAGSARRGAVLEVLAGPDGAVAWRVADVRNASDAVRMGGWRPPAGDAVALDGEWWSLVGAPVITAPLPVGDLAAFRDGDVVDAARRDVTGDGRTDLVVAFRRPVDETEVNRHFPDRRWADDVGRSAHLGVYRSDGFDQQWVAGTLFRPVGALAACDGSLAVAYTGLDTPMVGATGAWFWAGFGFQVAPALPGPGRPRCADVDGDGAADPVVLDRAAAG